MRNAFKSARLTVSVQQNRRKLTQLIFVCGNSMIPVKLQQLQAAGNAASSNLVIEF